MILTVDALRCRNLTDPPFWIQAGSLCLAITKNNFAKDSIGGHVLARWYVSNDDFCLVRYSRLLNHNKRYGHFDYPPLTYDNIRPLALEYKWEQQLQSRTHGHLECGGIQHGNRFGYYTLSPKILTSYTESSLASQLVYHPFDQSYRSSSTVT